MPTHYEDLIVWQKAMIVAEKVYIITKKFPDDEKIWISFTNEKSCCVHTF